MFCAISGEVPKEPVVSTKSGHLFEKKLIEKYLASEDTCPVTGEPLSKDDLLAVAAAQTARPRPITATSIPGLLSHFQNEWDAVMLEMFTLKQHLDSTRKELSQVLYQHDAACRVIARLARERDESRGLLSAGQGLHAQSTVQAVSAGSGGGTASRGMEVDTSAAAAAAAAGITDAVLSALASKGKELSKGRKKRAIPPTLAPSEAVAKYAELSSCAPHSTKASGVTCLDVQRVPTQGSASESLVTVSGGVDATARVYDHGKKQVQATLTGHAKKVTAALFHKDSGNKVLTASADKTVKIWSLGGGSAVCDATIGGFKAECTGLSVHPTGEYAAVACKDGSWAFASLAHATSLHTGGSGGGTPYHCACFHPDGLLLGLGGGSGNAEVWDMKTQTMIHAFADGHGGHDVSSIDFSENGYYMVSTSHAAGGEVKLWDLRKLTNLSTLALPGGKGGCSVKFDLSGTFLGIGCASGDVVVQGVKDWSTVATLTGHGKEVTAVSFNRDATTIASASMDRTVKLWGLK
mmetsp:Transcript_67046/g.131501  ORF Transcript_67046/g.131501 Transcript_67046/m.131501 type:complete len:522 (+) Transcript_67046:38-1603(+)